MNVAFACWNRRIAPVFDSARQILIVQVESGRIVREEQQVLPGIFRFKRHCVSRSWESERWYAEQSPGLSTEW
jgi:hypothetical protein